MLPATLVVVGRNDTVARKITISPNNMSAYIHPANLRLSSGAFLKVLRRNKLEARHEFAFNFAQLDQDVPV